MFRVGGVIMYSPFSRIFGKNDQNTQLDEDFSQDEVIEIPIQQIVPNRFQPRTIFNEEKIEELAQTIRTHGIIQPIIVRTTNNDVYEIIAGERRWRAVETLGWKTIPAILRDMTDTETASVALIENLQREELTVIEEATAYKQLIELHSLTQEALAQRLGRSQSTIANKLRLLHLPEEVQEALLQKQISERHARALIALQEKDDQIKILEKIKEEHLNVNQTEELIRTLKEPKKQEKGKRRVQLK